MKTCIISGAGSGIGRAASKEMAKNTEYSNYVLISLGMEALEETRQQMISVSGRNDINIDLYDQDLTEYEAVRKIVDEVVARYGRIDALLSIAGLSKRCSFLDTSMELLEKTFKINVFANFNLTQAVVRYMKETGGVLLFIASTSGSTPRPAWIAYACSKAAVLSITRTLTEELKEYGIKVFTLSPGRCATEMRHQLMPDEDASKIMQPESVGEMVAFLVGHPNCNLDGQDIVIRQQ